MDPRVMELRIKKWLPIMEAQANSGMTKKEWCAQNGIERTSFYRWQRRVRTYLIAFACSAMSICAVRICFVKSAMIVSTFSRMNFAMAIISSLMVLT